MKCWLTAILLLLACAALSACGTAAEADGLTGTVIESDTVETDWEGGPCAGPGCYIDGACALPGEAAPDNPCLACVPVVSVEAWTPRDGQPCDDGHGCTLDDLCETDLCVGTPTDCEDGDPCTDDVCVDDEEGCRHEPIVDGGGCEDGEPCTVNDTCVSGACVGGDAPICGGDNPCVSALCELGVGCVSELLDGLTCDDGDACTGGGVCAAGLCESHFAVTCEDTNICTADGCDPVQGCIYTDISGLCDDGNPCTNPGCDAELGCTYANNAEPCDDGNACTESDGCSQGKCQGATLSIDDENLCTDDACDPVSGISHTANALPCDDADACTLADTCADSACSPGEGVLGCDDENVCTADSCEADSGCLNVPVEGGCDDASVCTTADHCADGTCTGTLISCDDGNDCTVDLCDAEQGCSNFLALSHACRPEILVTYPPRAATILGVVGEAVVMVIGSVSSGAGPITGLLLNGEDVVVNGDGSFAHAVQPLTGGNTLVFDATDSFDTLRTRVQSFQWSVDYITEAAPDEAHADPGMGIFLSQEILDDGDHSLPADDLATILELGLASYDVGALLPSPVAEDVNGVTASYDVYLNNATHDPPVVSLVAIDGGLLLGIDILNLTADLHAKRVSGWLLPQNIYGTLTVSTIDIDATIQLSVSADHELEVNLTEVNVEISGTSVDIDSWLAFILEPIINGVLEDMTADLEDEFESEIENQIGPLIGGALSALAINQSFGIPPLDPGATEDILLDLATDFSATDFAPDGGALILRAEVTGPKILDHDKLGALARAGCGTDEQVMIVPRQAPLEVVLADDTLNLLLYRAWEAGMLTFNAPPELLAGADLASYGITDLAVTVDGMQAPVVSDCYADGALRLHLGDVGISATLLLLGSPLDVQLYVTLLAGFELSVVDNAIHFGLTEVESLDMEVTAVQDAFISSEGLIADLVAENLVPALLEGLGGSSLGGIPLPVIDLSGAMDGIPPGTVIAISANDIERQEGNTIVSGDLQ